MGDPKADAETIKNELKNKTKDTLINILTSRSTKERVQIKEAYKSAYGKDLVADIESELSGELRDVCKALFYSPEDYDCLTLRKAMKGLGTDEDTLIEILTTRDGPTLKKIIERYPAVVENRNLIEDIKDETSGDFMNICLALLEGNRSDNASPNEDECAKIANELYEAGEKKLGTDSNKFIEIFSQKSPLEIQVISKLYHKQTKNTILDALNGEFKGDMRKMMVAILYAVLSPSEYFATKIHGAIEGIGTNNDLLIRTLVSRAEVDMDKIKKYYKILYKVEMDEDIKGDTGGDYRKILLKLAGY